MAKLISQDSPFIQALERLGDLILLNLIYLITCIPIITIGAANTALYAVCFRMGTDREAGLLRTYFHSFRQNFKQSTLIWIPAVLVFADLIVTMFLTLFQPGLTRYLSLLTLFMFIGVFMVFGYIFPLISQFEDKTRTVLRNALILSLGYLPRSLLIALLNLLPFLILLLHPVMFFSSGSIWILLYFSTTTFINTRVLRKVFAPFMPEDTPNEGTYLY